MRNRLLKNVFKALFLVILFGFLCLAFYKPANRQAFEGTVSDKWIGVLETQSGVRSAAHITIKSDGGETFNVVVDDATFEQIQPEMRVKRDANGTVTIIR